MNRSFSLCFRSERKCASASAALVVALATGGLEGQQVLLSDSFDSGVRNVQSLPDQAAWYYSSSSRLEAQPGQLLATVDSSRLAIVYFTDGAPVELADGQELVVRLDFSVSEVNAASASRGLRIGLFNFGNATRLQMDDFSSGVNGTTGVTGYLVNMNFSTQFRLDNPLEIRRRNGDLDGFTTNGNLMGSVPGSGLYGPILGTGGSNGGAAFQSDVVYQLEYRVLNEGGVAKITVKISDDSGGEVVATAEDTELPVFGYDSFAFRPDGSGNTGTSFTLYAIEVEVLGEGDVIDPVDPTDPAAMANYLAAATELEDGYYATAALGTVHAPTGGEPFVYSDALGAWFHVTGLPLAPFNLYDVNNALWWATHPDWEGKLWSYDLQEWYHLDGDQLSSVPVDGTDPVDPPPVVAGGPIGYATVPDMGVTELTGGKGGQLVQVNTIAQLKAEVAGTAPKIIVITGNFEGADSISVGSNKTILGAHLGATFRGIGFELSNVSNVIMRNLRISHVLAAVANDGDGIRVVNGAHHIWIDHCEFFNDNPREQTNKDLYDGLVDITNGSDYVTVSWSHFHDHHKFILIGSTDTASRYNDDQHLRVTLHHNLLENPYKKDSRIGTRVPSLRFGKAHVFNCVYRNLGEGIRARHPSAKIRVESNVFDYLGYTWFSADGGCFTIGENLMLNEANKDARTVPFCNPEFEPPYAYAELVDPVEIVETLVVEGVGIGKIDPFEGLP